MRKTITAAVVLLFFCLASSAGAALSNYTYTIDIDIPNPDSQSNVGARVGGLEFEVSGGEYGTDWFVETGDAIPEDEGNWTFENYGSFSAIYDVYDYELDDYVPMLSGRVLTISSDVELNFLYVSFYRFIGGEVDPDYFTTTGFILAPEPVPVPGSFLVLSSGILAIFMTRKKSHESV